MIRKNSLHGCRAFQPQPVVHRQALPFPQTEANFVIESIPTSTELEPIVFFEESEDFDLLYDETLVGISEQEIITGVVTTIGKDYVTVDIGFKSDCLIPLSLIHI